jgi:hypothetical protein
MEKRLEICTGLVGFALVFIVAGMALLLSPEPSAKYFIAGFLGAASILIIIEIVYSNQVK